MAHQQLFMNNVRLAERLYDDQGVNTQSLLGHRSPQQTAKYHDDRGKDWSYIQLANSLFNE